MYIGIDLGTSGVKILLVKADGTLVRTITKNYELLIPKPSWTEQEPKVWFEQTLKGLEELVIGYEDKIKGISFSGQMHGLVLLDKDNNVLRNALLWNDQRTTEEVDYLNQEVGIDKLLKFTGNIALTGLTMPKLLWVKNNEPHIFKKISKIMLPKDYLIYMLSGVFASDVSDLSGTLYFDPRKRDYSQEMLEIADLSKNHFPQPFESFEVVGLLKDNIKQILHIDQDVKIIAGGGDQAVGAVGVGIVNDGDCSISLGTSGVIFVSSQKFIIDTKSHLQSYAHANGKYHIMAVMLNAAGAIKWWNESIFHSNDYQKFYQQIQKNSNNEDLFFLPYLSGERSPINDPFAKGVLYGLGIHHKKEDLDTAVLEGVTFALKDSFELIKKLGIPINRVRVTGGGAKSDIWLQLISDVLGVETIKITAEEGPALGAAILAMVGCEEYDTVEEACLNIVQEDKHFYPNEEMVIRYGEKYHKFKWLYPTIKHLYTKI